MKNPQNKALSQLHVLIIADIEGSSGCGSYAASSFMTPEWPPACLEMTRDVNAVITALFASGVGQVTVKDFHRTAWNIFPEGIDPRARLVSGYQAGPVPGIGDPADADAVMFLGMHAASGSDGFLPHTLTSRLARVEVNGRLMPEVSLFAASLAPFGISPVFLSGCPLACAQAREYIPGIHTFSIDKAEACVKTFRKEQWRKALAEAAVNALLSSTWPAPHLPHGPFDAVVTLRDGKAVARKLARRWGLDFREDRIFIQADHIHDLYHTLIRICYLTPVIERILPLGLRCFNLRGLLGLAWARRHVHGRLLSDAPSI